MIRSKQRLIRLQTLVDAAMLLVATVYLAYPASRVLPLHIALFFLMVVSGAVFTWRLHLSGVLRMTPRGFMGSTERSRPPLLSSIAVMAALIALVVSSLR
jgi:hypothetical protein